MLAGLKACACGACKGGSVQVREEKSNVNRAGWIQRHNIINKIGCTASSFKGGSALFL